VNHKEFIGNLSEQQGLSRKKTIAYTHSLTDIFLKTLKKEDIQVSGFGKFIYEHNKRPKFEAGRKFLKEINIK
jgi:nucleoid DNA-binding protein